MVPVGFSPAIRFAASRRLLVEFDGDSPFAQKSSGMRVTGAGDSQLGIQLVLQHEQQKCPGVSLAYYIKLPTASSIRGLGTGRVDHSFIGLLSKTYLGAALTERHVSGQPLNLSHASSAGDPAVSLDRQAGRSSSLASAAAVCNQALSPTGA